MNLMLRKLESSFIYTNPIKRKIIIEVNLQPSWPSYLLCTVFVVRQSLCTIPGKNQLYTHLVTLGATFIGHRVRQGMYTYLGSAGHLVLATFIGYRVHRGLYIIVEKTSYYLQGLRKPTFAFPRIVCDSVHNSRKKQLYTYT